MKVSAVLIGVNVAATLSVAAQHPACAQDGLGTADFLKSTLVEASAPKPALMAAPAKSLAMGTTKVSMSSPRSVATRKALNAPGVKLRPFVANRKLPSKTELDGALSFQTASMDYSDQPTTLDGGVQEYSSYYMSGETQDVPMTPRAKYAVKQQQKRAESQRLQNAAKVASSFVRQTAPRAVPGAMPAVPGQVGFPCAETSFNNFSLPQPFRREMHPMMQSMQSMQSMPRPQMQMQQFAPPQFGKAPMAPEAPLRPPNLSPQEQLEMNKLVENACIEQGVNPNAVGAGATDLYSRVGPPPFPLSLIPEDTMKDFLKGARSRKSAVAGSNLSMASGGGHGMGSGHLPAAGFRSYLTQTTSSAGLSNYSRLPTAMPISKHPTQHPGAGAKAHHHPAKKNVSASNLSMHNEIPKNQILVYPPYRSQVNFGS